MILEYLWQLIPSSVKPRFIGDIPSASDEGVSLTVEGSTEITRFFQPATRIVSQTVICNIRTKKYTVGHSHLQKIKKALDSKKDIDNRILSITLQTSDDYLGINEEKLHEFQVIFKIIVEEDI
jgi:hypothetical protein